MYIGTHVKYPLFLSHCNETWIFQAGFRKILKYQISLKSVKWEPSCSMRTDDRTDRHDEANSRFSLFCGRDYKYSQRNGNTSRHKKKCCLQPPETAISFWQKWGEMFRNSGKAAISCPTSGSSLGVINSNETASTHPWVPAATWCTGNVPTDTVPFKLTWQQRRFTP